MASSIMLHTATRRSLLTLMMGSALTSCTARLRPLPPLSIPDALALSRRAALAHGAAALGPIQDISVSYAGRFHTVVDRLQPLLVDAGHRGTAQDRIIPAQGLIAQAQAGPDGTKHVYRDTGDVQVWFDATRAQDRPRQDAAAVVADCYMLFLLGPALLAGPWANRAAAMALAEPERITVGGQDHECDVLRIHLTPGLGRSEADELALYIDRAEHLMRRLRFTLNGFQPTRGALAETDCWGHFTRSGIRWPTEFVERLLRPLPLPVHEWRMTGLDLDRGLDRNAVLGPAFTGKAARPASTI